MLGGLDRSPIQISAQQAPAADRQGEEEEPPPGSPAGTWQPERPAVRGSQLRRLLGCEAWKLKCSSAHHGTQLRGPATYRTEQQSAPHRGPIGYEHRGQGLGRLNAAQHRSPCWSTPGPERMFHSSALSARPAGISRLAPSRRLTWRRARRARRQDGARTRSD